MDNCIKIERGDLVAYIAEPGKRYARTRFDWTGFIPQIYFKGHTFCTPEGDDWHTNDTGGEGLCNEFKASNIDMGFDNNNNFFLKPGVGLLERTDDKPYHFAVDYRIKKPFPCTMQVGDDHIDFKLDAIELDGLAYETNKHIGIINDMLIITTTIANIGEKPLHFREYNHNFLSINGLGANPNVNLSLPKKYRNSVETEGLVTNEGSITFTDKIKSSFMIYCEDVDPYRPMRWKLYDERANISVQEFGDFNVTDFFAWGGPHVISPEVYGDFPVKPGMSRSWTRLWKFSIDEVVYHGY